MNQTAGIVSSAMGPHRAYQMYAHIVWRTWCRVGCVNSAAVGDIRSALTSASKKTGVRVLRHAELEDHVHVLVSFLPDQKLSDFVRLVKSVSSFRAGQRMPGAIKWARGYYVATYHRKDLVRVANYVMRQYQRPPDRVPTPSRRSYPRAQARGYHRVDRAHNLPSTSDT